MADADSLTIEDTSRTFTDADALDLFAGDELSSAETEAITLHAPTQLVVLAGAEGSGKTTMLASLYEHLCRGSFAGFDFAGSRSLLGFEKICHTNRVASGGARPTTERTIPSNEAAYYHLALREAAGDRRRRQVLLSALSGELYRWARNSREECERLTFLRRADVIAVLIDGAKLVSLEQRVNAYADAAGILDSFLDAKMIAPRCHVEFIFSKLDRIRAAGPLALAFLKQTQEKLEARFQVSVSHLGFREIAARPGPSTEEEELSRGLARAFTSWVTPLPRISADVGSLPRAETQAREISKMGWRYADRNGRGVP